MYKERKEITHREVDENAITTSSNIYIYQRQIQCLLSLSGHKTNVQE